MSRLFRRPPPQAEVCAKNDRGHWEIVHAGDWFKSPDGDMYIDGKPVLDDCSEVQPDPEDVSSFYVKTRAGEFHVRTNRADVVRDLLDANRTEPIVALHQIGSTDLLKSTRKGTLKVNDVTLKNLAVGHALDGTEYNSVKTTTPAAKLQALDVEYGRVVNDYRGHRLSDVSDLCVDPTRPDRLTWLVEGGNTVTKLDDRMPSPVMRLAYASADAQNCTGLFAVDGFVAAGFQSGQVKLYAPGREDEARPATRADRVYNAEAVKGATWRNLMPRPVVAVVSNPRTGIAAIVHKRCVGFMDMKNLRELKIALQSPLPDDFVGGAFGTDDSGRDHLLFVHTKSKLLVWNLRDMSEAALRDPDYTVGEVEGIARHGVLTSAEFRHDDRGRACDATVVTSDDVLQCVKVTE